jgi:hypothetical protein
VPLVPPLVALGMLLYIAVLERAGFLLATCLFLPG